VSQVRSDGLQSCLAGVTLPLLSLLKCEHLLDEMLCTALKVLPLPNVALQLPSNTVTHSTQDGASCGESALLLAGARS
jgi:hypothetical protein